MKIWEYNWNKKAGLLMWALFLSMCLSANPDSTRFQIKNVEIFGESNVMDFTIKYDSDAMGEIKQNRYSHSSESKEERVFDLPVEKFEAPNKQIKSDFEHMLKAKEFPEIQIRLDEKLCLEKQRKVKKPQDLAVNITIGGVERLVKIECISQEALPNGREFKGQGIVRLSDFNLEPPKRLFGLIKVKETIIITFDVEVVTP